MKDIEAQCRIFAEVTCAAKILKRADRAAEEIHELVAGIWAESRPGYLEIHRDLVDLQIPVPKHIVEWDGRYPAEKSDARKLKEAVADVAERIRAAKKPILIGGVELYRDRAEGAFRELAEKLGAPVVTCDRACFIKIIIKSIYKVGHIF